VSSKECCAPERSELTSGGRTADHRTSHARRYFSILFAVISALSFLLISTAFLGASARPTFLHHWRPVRVRDAGPGICLLLFFTRDFLAVSTPRSSPADRLFPSPAPNCYNSAEEAGPCQIRSNVSGPFALVGQSGAGKTTLAEALLAKAGAIPRPAASSAHYCVRLHPLEKQMQHSLKLAVASFDAKTNGEATRIHLLDTPGYPDFLGQSLPALAAVETAASSSTRRTASR